MLPAVVLESADGRNLLQQGPDGGATTPLLLEVPRPLFRSMDLGETPPASVKLWELPWHPTGLRQWWCAGDIVNDTHPSLRGAGVPRFILNSWNRWAQYTVLFALVGLCLKNNWKGEALTAIGPVACPTPPCQPLVLWLCSLARLASVESLTLSSQRASCHPFVDDRLKDVVVELLLPLDEEYVVAFCFLVAKPQLLCASGSRSMARACG